MQVLYVISSLFASGAYRGISVSDPSIFLTYSFTSGATQPLCLLPHLSLQIQMKPMLVVAFGLLRMLRCQILLFPTCSAQVSLQTLKE